PLCVCRSARSILLPYTALFRSDTGEQAGPDLRGLFLGSEGTLGITTKVTVRLLRTPETVRTLLADFPSVAAAGDVVSDIVAAGRSEEHTSELQSRENLVCRLLL